MKTLSICIPTFERQDALKELLSSLCSEDTEGVEICISDNGSKDHTREVVERFSQEHPGLIKYFKHKKNQGVDYNIIFVMGMASARFIWMLGDKENIRMGSVAKLVDFLKKNHDMMSMIVKRELHRIEKKKKIVYYTTYDSKAPKTMQIPREDIIKSTGFDNAVLSTLFLKRIPLQNLLKENGKEIEKAFGTYYIHRYVHSMLFMKHKQAKSILLNELVLSTNQPRFKRAIEDEFNLVYKAGSIHPLLRRSKYYAGCEVELESSAVSMRQCLNFSNALLAMKAFNAFKYISYGGCLKLFFKKTGPGKGIFLSTAFISYSVMPARLACSILKLGVKRKHKQNAEKIWQRMEIMHDNEGGERRRTYDPENKKSRP